MPTDPNLPIPTYPTLEPMSALTFGQLITEVAYKIGCAYYGSDGTAAASAPIDAHDLALCSKIANDAVRKFISDGPKGSGWRWLNAIAQVDLWPQISYDPTGSTFVTLTPNPTVNGVTYNLCTLLTLYTPPTPPGTPSPSGVPPQPIPTPTPPFGYQNGNISYVPRFLQSMELRQIWLNGNPPSTTPGFFLPINNSFTGTAIGTPWTVLRYISPTQLIIDGNATIAVPVVTQNTIGWSPFATAGVGNFAVSVTTATGTQTIASNIVPGNTSGSAAGIASLLNALSNVGAGNAIVTPIASNAAFPGPTNGYNYSVTFKSAVGPAYVSLGAIGSNLAGTQTAAPFSFACSGDYTLPANFGGQYTGQITYVANTNRGMVLSWTSEYAIRSRRQNYNIESGTPYEAAVRLMPTPSYAPLTNSGGFMLPRHRWELMTWRISSEFLSVLFPYTLSFNTLVNTTDVPPSPLGFDEALLSCCRAMAEKEVEDTTQGVDWQYYENVALPNAWQLDMRSAPKKIGYFGNPTSEGTANPIQAFRDIWYQRPVVPVFGTS